MNTKIEFQGFRSDKEWPHYAWRFTIGAESFEYRTGTGHASPRELRDKRGYFIKHGKKPNRAVIVCAETNSWAHVPSADEILHSLFSDAQLGSESFNEFCSNLGYDNDSLKALDTYRACMETAEKLRKALGAAYANESKRIEALAL